ncbi:HEAT repeat-containing protein 6-like [Gigantopelta aegis]|uniref:HEAT repeat-containing protein 6-like n=1 Tax=Gigantopelta aegis TaxID=1735272 RepID=UPI001B88E725|nr:HEAT repeat-containing protein 6-like [Gigantopelta aegis]
MAEAGDFLREDRQKFQSCCQRLLNYRYQDEETSKTNLHLILDELNSVEYITNIINDHTASQLYRRLPNLAPLHDERLIVKICQVILNLRTKQQILLDASSLPGVVEFLIKAVQRCPSWCLVDILLALSATLYGNSNRISEFHESLIGNDGILKQLTNEEVLDEDVLSGAVFCLENLTAGLQNHDVLNEENGKTCFEIFIRMLHFVPVAKMDASIQCKILIASLRGIQNLLLTTKLVPTDYLGRLLAAIRAHMFYGLSGQPVNVPPTLYATPQIHYDLQATKGAESPAKTQSMSKDELPENPAKSSRRGKKKRGVKPEKVKPLNETEVRDRDDSLQSHSSSETSQESAFHPSWIKISSSESEYSDTEGGRVAKLRSCCAKVRQSAFGCLHTIVRNVDKRIIFGYWSAFIPDSAGPGNTPQLQTLFTAILKDPSPKCRMGASAALTALIDGTKPFLAAAEDNHDVRTAFVPFSVILGSMIKELHRCLLLALIAENFPLTLTQLIKCLSTLVSNVPYHRLQPGLLGRIVKQIRHFLNHKDPNVRVACLTCIGSIVDIHPPLLEVCHIIQPAHPPLGVKMHHVEDTKHKPASLDNGTMVPVDSGFNSLTNLSLAESVQATDISSCQPAGEKQTGASTSQFVGGQGNSERVTTGPAASQLAGHSASEKPADQSTAERLPASGSHPVGQNQSSHSSTSSTPALAVSPGTQTPVFSDQTLQRHAKEISWVLKMCTKNIMQQPADSQRTAGFEPIPVRLESLQVVANLTKGYFPVIRNSLALLQELIQVCLEDKDPIIKLHGTKVLDELSQVLRNDIQKPEVAGPDAVSLEKVLEFWLCQLNGPLPGILQTVTYNPVRANACDCIANIGSEVFSCLPMDKRILCLTLVLGLTSDDDKLVKSASIRTVGVYVLYPCLREDVSFVADAANSVIMTMADSSINVRMKAAWSMANLCDALILNKESGDAEFVADFSDMLLLKLLTTSTQSAQDSDKVKSNAVRAVGNLLRYLPQRSLAKPVFVSAIEDCIKTLVKNITSGTMKVRWNACYAIGNMFHNTLLYLEGAPWMTNVLDALSTVVKDCKNFKVRINAALALSVPSDRVVFGSAKQFAALWNSLIVALSSSENITDFAEFRYQDNLTEQICMALLNMLLLVRVDDLSDLLMVLQEQVFVLLAHMAKIRVGKSILVTESLLKKCQCYVEVLANTAECPDHHTAIRHLHDICIIKEKPLNEELGEEDEKKPLQSGFQQIYD